MQTYQQFTALITSALAALSFSSKAADIPTKYEKKTGDTITRYEASEIGLDGKPVVHEIDFTSIPPEGRTGGAFISGDKPSTSGLMIGSDCPIAILSAKQKVEIDFYGEASTPNDFTTYNYIVSNDKETLIAQKSFRISIPGSEISWENSSEYFTINFDFYSSPIVSDSTSTFCVPAASIAQSSKLVPRNVYIKDVNVADIKGFVWAENAQNRFEWLTDRSLRDQPTMPALTYPSQGVSYIKLRKVEQPKWSDNASKIGIKIDGESLNLTFSNEPFDRTVEATTDLKEWTEVYTLPAHETNIVILPYTDNKFFRIGELK